MDKELIFRECGNICINECNNIYFYNIVCIIIIILLIIGLILLKREVKKLVKD